MPLYHKNLCLPVVEYPDGIFRLRYTNHAIDEAKYDRHGIIQLPKYIDTLKAKKIEVETDDNNNLVKILYKTKLDKDRDLCLVVLLTPKDKWTVKTVWSEEVGDDHKSLNPKKYYKVG